MYSQIFQMRVRGRRKSQAEIDRDQGVFGAIRHMQKPGHSLLFVHAWDDGSLLQPIIPVLYEPQITGMHYEYMTFRGLERCVDAEENGATYLQEWRVKIIGFGKPAGT